MCGILTAFEAMDVYVLGVIISPLTTGLGVSLATFGIVFTFQAIGQIAGTYFIAPLADKVGRRPVILYCTLGFGIMTISSAASPNLQIFILQRIVAFFLIGGAVPNLFAIASEFGARKRRHRNTLIIGSFHGIGAGLAFIVGGLLLDFGWRAPLLACGVLTLISLALAFFFMPESMRFLLTKPEREDQLRKLVQVIDASVNFSSIKAPAGRNSDGQARCLQPIQPRTYANNALTVDHRSADYLHDRSGCTMDSNLFEHLWRCGS